MAWGFKIPKKEPVKTENVAGDGNLTSSVKTDDSNDNEIANRTKNQSHPKSTHTQPSAYDMRPASRSKPAISQSYPKTLSEQLQPPCAIEVKWEKVESVDFDEFVSHDPVTSTPPRSDANCAPSIQYNFYVYMDGLIR